MALMQELLAWTKGLQAWQSDALARLLAKKELSPADQDDLYALLKVAHGIPDPEKIGYPIRHFLLPGGYG